MQILNCGIWKCKIKEINVNEIDSNEIIKFAELMQQAIAQESSNTKVIMEILENLKSCTSNLSDRVSLLEDQIINIIKTIKENQ